MRPIIIALLLATPALATAPDTSVTYGVWQNPNNSVHARVERCGTKMCGVVVWANEKAIADAAEGGSPNLVGMSLLHSFTQVDATHWKGKVFIPDVGKTYSLKVTEIDEDTLTGKGCLFGGIGCQSQTWTRVK